MASLRIISHFVLTHRMTNSQRLATVRACLLGWLADQQNGSEDQGDVKNPILRETMLIRDEFYCGRRFHAASHHAVWFIEEDELKIYHQSGELVCVLSGDQIQVPKREHDDSRPHVIKLPTPVDHSDEHRDENDGEIRRAA